MSSLSRTFARASRRGNRLMEQYQQPGVYAWAEEIYKQAQETKKRRRLALTAKIPAALPVPRATAAPPEVPTRSR